MSLDFYLREPPRKHVCICGLSHECSAGGGTLFSENITHNLTPMFNEAGIYEILWRGDGMIAGDVLPKLRQAIDHMRANPAKYKKHDSPNGWGTYDSAIRFLDSVIKGCSENPTAIIQSCR